MNNKNNNQAHAAKLPALLVLAITLVAALVAVFETLGSYFTAIRSSGMSLRKRLAHGVAAVWVTLSRARTGLRQVRQS